METTDIFIEASKGAAFAAPRAITDEVLWEHNETGYRPPFRLRPVWYRGTPIFRRITPSRRHSVVI